MIIEGILSVLGAFVGVLLSPLTLIPLSFNLLSSIPIVMDFIKLIIYVLPWSNLIPLLGVVFAVALFKLIIAILTTIKAIIPGI